MKVLRFSGIFGLLAIVFILLLVLALIPVFLIIGLIVLLIGAILGIPLILFSKKRKNQNQGKKVLDAEYKIK